MFVGRRRQGQGQEQDHRPQRPGDLSDKAKRALLGAESVHVKLEDKSPDAEKDDPATMDLTLDRDGNCAGTLTFAREGGTADLVKRGDKVWLKPDEAFWRNQVPQGQGAAAAELFKGRYLHGTTNDAMLKDLAEVCDLKELQRNVNEDADDSDDVKNLKKGDETTVAGTKVIPLTGTEDGTDKTLYVASEGTPVPDPRDGEGQRHGPDDDVLGLRRAGAHEDAVSQRVRGHRQAAGAAGTHVR
ncbi:hypothetical protein RB200_30650 [Streptomyces sp. PmtG]